MRALLALCLIASTGALPAIPLNADEGRGEWPLYRHDGRLTARSPGVGDLTSPAVVWKHDLRGYRWWIAVKPGDRESTLRLDDASEDAPGAGKPWRPQPLLADLAGDGVMVPAPAYTAKVLREVPGLQTFAVSMADGERGRCELVAFDRGRRVVWQSEEFRVFQGPHPVIADANADGQLDVVVCPHYQVAVLDGASGKTMQRLRWHDGRNYGHFIVKNIDDDAALEMCVLADFYSHMAMVDNDGKDLRVLWKKEIELTTVNKVKILRPRWDPLQDLDGDGRFELIVNLYNDGGDERWHVIVIDALTGESRADGPGLFLEGLEDVDGDGRAELFTTETEALFVPASAPLRLLEYRAGRFSRRWSRASGAWVTAARPYPLHINSNVAHGNLNVVTSDAGAGRRGFFVASPPDEPGGPPLLEAFRVAPSGAVELAWSVRGPPGGRAFTVATGGSRAGDDISTRIAVETSSPRGKVSATAAGLALEGRERTVPQTGSWGSLIAARLGKGRVPALLVAAGNSDVVALRADEAGPRELWRRRGAGPIVAVDLDGDGEREAAFFSWEPSGEGNVTALAADGSLLWKTPLRGFPGPLEPWNFGTLTFLTAGRFTNPGRDDLIAFARRSTMHSDEGFLLSGKSGEILWRRAHVSDGERLWAFGGKPVAVHDHDGDGLDDVHGLYPVNYSVVRGLDGRQLLGKSAAGDAIFPGIWAAYAEPLLFAFNSRTALDLVWSGGYLLGMTDLGGATRWAVQPAQTAYPVDLEGDGRHLIAAHAGPTVSCYEPDRGERRWQLSLDSNARVAAVADVDGDGGDELIVAHGNSLSSVGAAAGAPRLEWRLDLPAAASEVILADSDADGKLEVIVLGDDGLLRGVDQPAPPAGDRGRGRQ